jgi:iron-sulfur cluster assembly accessory protein
MDTIHLPPATTTTNVFSFSSAASATSAAPSKRRRIVDDKDPIVVTPRAEDRIQQLLQNQPDAVGIRLGVRRRGCNGLSYTLNYANQDDDHSKNINLQTPNQKINVWIEPMALFSIVGTTMDWEETELTSEFTFHNPNSKGSCGCGESFNV